MVETWVLLKHYFFGCSLWQPIYSIAGSELTKTTNWTSSDISATQKGNATSLHSVCTSPHTICKRGSEKTKQLRRVKKIRFARCCLEASRNNSRIALGIWFNSFPGSIAKNWLPSNWNVWEHNKLSYWYRNNGKCHCIETWKFVSKAFMYSA